jgi:hypothetical protein
MRASFFRHVTTLLHSLELGGGEEREFGNTTTGDFGCTGRLDEVQTKRVVFGGLLSSSNERVIMRLIVPSSTSIFSR